MISVISEKDEKKRRSLSRALIQTSIDYSDYLGNESEYNFTNLLRRDRSRNMFLNYPKTEKEFTLARENAIKILAIESNEFLEEEKSFARIFLYHFNRGDSVRKFFIQSRDAIMAKNKTFQVARNGFVFNTKEDEELV